MAITFNSVSPSSRASQTFIELAGVRQSFASLFIPPHVGLIGQYENGKSITDYVGQKVVSKNDVGNRYGWGSQIHRQALKLPDSVFSSGGGVTAFPIPEESGGTAASKVLTFTGTSTSAGTYFFRVGGEDVQVAIPNGTTAINAAAAVKDAVTAIRDIAVSATVPGTPDGTFTLTCKWKGLTGNQIYVAQNPGGKFQEDQAPAGLTLAGVDAYLASGATDPSVHDVFMDSNDADILGDTWYTVFTAPFSDATNIGYYDQAGTLRAAPGVRRFFGAYPVLVNETRTNALAYPATINSEWVGAAWDTRPYAPAFELSAEIAGIIAREQNINPARPYKTLSLSDGARDGTDSTYAQADALFRAGIGYMKVASDGTLRLGDLPLTYRTDSNGGDTEEWFDAVSLHARQAKVYSIEQLFGSEPYTRGIVVDNQAVTNLDYAIAPKDVVADLHKLIDDLWVPNAWTKNAEAVKESVTAEINAYFGGRIDSSVTDDEAKALRIIANRYAYLY
jgi:phage tail sheath gpL-like